MLPAINSFKICHDFVSGEESDDVQILAALVGGKLFFASSFYVSAELWPRNILQHLRLFSSKLQRTAAVLQIIALERFGPVDFRLVVDCSSPLL